MGWRETLGGLFGRTTTSAPTSTASLAASTKLPDVSSFKRSTWPALGPTQAAVLLQYTCGEVGPDTTPDRVPLETLGLMGWDPVVYLGEQAATAPVKDTEVYFVEADDEALEAETYAWLWPILPSLLRPITRSVALGVVPYVLDWDASNLTFKVAVEGKSPRNKTLPDHVHYKGVHELWPGDAEIKQDGRDGFTALRYNGQDYRAGRADNDPPGGVAFVSVYERQFGSWLGQGSRRRAFRPWFDGVMVELWEGRWLEGSVDPPRIGFAPEGNITIDGQEVPATQLLADVFRGLKNGDAAGLPSTLTKEGQPAWRFEVMDLPDRADVWAQAVNRRDARKLLASLCPPSTVGAEDATFAGARIPGEMFVEFVEGHCRYAAEELTKVVEVVHAVRYGKAKPAPRVRARQIPQAKRKLLLEVFRTAALVEQQVGEGKVVTLAELVSPAILNELGVETRPLDAAAREPASKPSPDQPGRPRDTTGQREDRRGSATTPEGQDAVGGDGEQAGG